MRRIGWIVGAVAATLANLAASGPASAETPDYERSRWDPIHFRPAIEQASNEQCLVCHSEILQNRPLAQSEAGVRGDQVLAWYQTLDIYQGEQDTFHRRHLVTPLANQLMDLKCTFCHQGNDPREEAPIPPDPSNVDFTLRKMVNTETTCLRCHGQFAYKVMSLPGPWHQVGDSFGGNCLACHGAIRTTRHQVNYLKAAAIEEAGAKDSAVCYGCHGGRAWYRIAYPYPRHSWPGMSKQVPDWAQGRPGASDARFLLHSAVTTPAAEAATVAATSAPGASSAAPLAGVDLAKAKGCFGCHAMDKKVFGPSLQDVADKYRGDAEAAGRLNEKVKTGGGGAWGSVPMPPNPQVDDQERGQLVEWILSLQ